MHANQTAIGAPTVSEAILLLLPFLKLLLRLKLLFDAGAIAVITTAAVVAFWVHFKDYRALIVSP